MDTTAKFKVAAKFECNLPAPLPSSFIPFPALCLNSFTVYPAHIAHDKKGFCLSFQGFRKDTRLCSVVPLSYVFLLFWLRKEPKKCRCCLSVGLWVCGSVSPSPLCFTALLRGS